MKLAIIGAGNVGGALGAAWAKKAGHDIFFGVRDPKAENTQKLLSAIGGKARAGTPAEAAAAADVIVVSTPWPATEAAIRSMGNIKGKVILDTTNPLTRGPDGIGLEIGHSISSGEKVQGWAADASVFKTLNTTGFGNMADPQFKHGNAVMFVAGDDTANKPKVVNLVGELGFEVIDAGPLRNARLLEAHAMLWIDLALVRGQGRDYAFSILRR
jgi:8-hydroxy-5-deazaflavin:NADPH oxidoreductase